MEGDRYYTIRITPELLDTILTRDHNGNALTWDVTEPDHLGVREVVITTNYDDNICDRLNCCGNCHGSGYHDGAFGCFKDYDYLFVNKDPQDSCQFAPSRWKERTP